MSYIYSDTNREDAYSLPNVEVFYAPTGLLIDEDGEPMPAGWYWQACYPGCLPDGEPMGPYDTEAEAIADAQEE